MQPAAFTLHVDEAKLDELKAKLARARLPDAPPDARWTHGPDPAFMRRLIDHWRSGFDWRAQERSLNQFPQYTVRIGDIDLHYLHAPAESGSGRPLLLCHGWPGSVFEFIELIPRLTDPVRFGGRAEDAFTVVAPSLPGYGLSSGPGQRLATVREMVDCLVTLMTEVLGYGRFATQGGDIGAWVTSMMGALHPGHVAGIHLNMLRHSGGFDGEQAPPVDSAESDFLSEVQRWRREEGAYGHVQGTRPLALAYALTDSPVGLAAWMMEKFQAWSDCGGDVESVFSLDRLLADISFYWFTESIFSSFAPYVDEMRGLSTTYPKVAVPVGYCQFPHEIVRPPRSFAERTYADIRRWTVAAKGGHFAALEQPDVLAEEVRHFFRALL